MRPARPPRIPFSLLFLLLSTLLLLTPVSASRPRPHILSKRNPTYSPLTSRSTLLNLTTLTDLDKTFDWNDKESLLSKVLIPREVGSDNLKTLQRMFEDKFSSLGWEVEKDTFTTSTPLGPQTFTNLIFTHSPLSTRQLVLSAHLDSKYFPPSSPSHGKFIGATDSAVPCVVLFDLAESLTSWLDARKERIRQEGGEQGREDGEQGEGLRIVFFDGEEAFQDWSGIDSIYGAKHLVERWEKPDSLPKGFRELLRERGTRGKVWPKNELERTSHLVLLDLLGAKGPIIRNFYKNTGWFFDEFRESEQKLGQMGLLWPSVGGGGEEYDKVSNEAGRKEKSFFVDRRLPQSWIGTIEDDHLPFLKKGVPVVHLISVPFPKVWHTIGDDASALDLDTIKAWALIVRLTVAEYLGLDPELNSAIGGGSSNTKRGGGEAGAGKCKDELLPDRIDVREREGICTSV